MIVVIDNGHGAETAGKRSPDGKFREYKYCREIATEVVKRLQTKGYNAQRLVPEDRDISLVERCRRVNAICSQFGKQNVILISIHCNASGSDCKWHTGTGWEAWTSVGETKADKLATYLYNAAGAVGLRLRTDETDGDPDKEGHLYILKHSACPAVLTENMFQDTKSDVDFMLSDKGREAIISLHVNGITNYIKSV